LVSMSDTLNPSNWNCRPSLPMCGVRDSTRFPGEKKSAAAANKSIGDRNTRRIKAADLSTIRDVSPEMDTLKWKVPQLLQTGTAHRGPQLDTHDSCWSQRGVCSRSPKHQPPGTAALIHTARYDEQDLTGSPGARVSAWRVRLRGR
jgi:hypothetical protein